MRHYYFRPTGKGGAPPSLTQETICRHLEGEITIALYAINPGTQRCRWVAIDADYQHAMEYLVKLEYELKQDQVELALEMSKRGGPALHQTVPGLAGLGGNWKFEI